MASVGETREQGLGPSFGGVVDDAGRIVFASWAPNLDPPDANPLTDVYFRALDWDGSTCPAGSAEDGVASSIVHGLVEPTAPSLKDQLHQTNCGVLVPLGL